MIKTVGVYQSKIESAVCSGRGLSYLLGSGAALFAFHAEWLSFENSEGVGLLHLPQIGFILLAFVVGYLWIKGRLSFGPRIIGVPMVVIAIAPMLRLIVDPTWHVFVGGLFGLMLFGLYLSARVLGPVIFYAFVPFIVIETISLIIQGIFINPGRNIGGLVSPTNWDLATGFMVFGALVYSGPKRWLVVTVAAVGLFFTGAPEMIVSFGICGAAVLVRRDWGPRLAVFIAVIGVVALLWFAFGDGKELYQRVWDKSEAGLSGGLEETNQGWDDKLVVLERSVVDISAFGHGYEILRYASITGVPTVHNVPFVILDQVGIFAAIAWVFVSAYCFIKTRWRYAWVAVFSVCLFDHYIWTTIAPYWWLLVGVSTTYAMESDMIFKTKGAACSNKNDLPCGD